MYAKYVRRLFDILLSLLGMPLLALILLIFAPIIHFTDRGPVFYNAPRLGRNGSVFKMFKLRSMRVNAPDIRLEDGSTYNGADDPRVTKVGRFLRKTSLDESPQILNVLKGDMSVVGPRPDLPEHKALYEGDEIEKLRVRPGITGYSQAYFRNNIEWKERLKNDVYYARNVRFGFDVRIFLQTVASVLLRKNIFVEKNDQ